MCEIKEIERIVLDGSLVTVDGKQYSAHDMKMVVDERRPSPLNVRTLSGLRDYLDTNVDSLVKESLIIVVNNHRSVSLYKQIDPDSQRRFCFIEVSLDESGKKFPFDQFIDSETFLIRIQSMFLDGYGDISKLRTFLSKLTINESIQARDDGISQEVVVKKGMSGALKESAVAPAIVSLTPNRTFSEVVQPESKFLFRMKAMGESLPSCALFEADGGAWKVEAMKNIKSWLSEEINDVSIIA